MALFLTCATFEINPCSNIRAQGDASQNTGYTFIHADYRRHDTRLIVVYTTDVLVAPSRFSLGTRRTIGPL